MPETRASSLQPIVDALIDMLPTAVREFSTPAIEPRRRAIGVGTGKLDKGLPAISVEDVLRMVLPTSPAELLPIGASVPSFALPLRGASKIKRGQREQLKDMLNQLRVQGKRLQQDEGLKSSIDTLSLLTGHDGGASGLAFMGHTPDHVETLMRSGLRGSGGPNAPGPMLEGNLLEGFRRQQRSRMSFPGMEEVVGPPMNQNSQEFRGNNLISHILENEPFREALRADRFRRNEIPDAIAEVLRVLGNE